jgi:uncharacterized protein YjhX (UPF0386 family)
MMNTKKSPLSHLFKYAIVLPVVFSMYFINSLFGRPLQVAGNDHAVLAASDYSVFDGYYKLQKNIRLVIRIQATEKGLVLKELWSEREINFSPVTDLEFRNVEMQFPLKFIKGNDGRVTEILAFEEDLWVKVNDLNPAPIQEFRLSPEELKAFAGYYQFERNADEYLEFSVKENGLVAKQLWDDKEFFILPKSPLEFYTVNEKHPAKFTKDQSGKVTQVLVFNKDVWKKVATYTPRKVVKLSPQKLKEFEGKYTFQFEPGQDSYIQITAREDHLILKEAWSGNEVEFQASSDLEFYNVQRSFPLKFTKDNTGKVVKVLAFNRDLWSRVKE